MKTDSTWRNLMDNCMQTINKAFQCSNILLLLLYIIYIIGCDHDNCIVNFNSHNLKMYWVLTSFCPGIWTTYIMLCVLYIIYCMNLHFKLVLFISKQPKVHNIIISNKTRAWLGHLELSLELSLEPSLELSLELSLGPSQTTPNCIRPGDRAC